MGSVCSSSSADSKVVPDPSLIIDQELKHEQVRDTLHFKLLTLGAGESGKSTVIKQLNFIHQVGMDQRERDTFIKVIQNNTIQCMTTFIKEASNFAYPLSIAEQAAAARVLEHDSDHPLSPALVDDLDLLWKSDTIQKTFARRDEFWCLEMADYYFSNMTRFVAPGYTPTIDDIVMARKRTTGVVITDIDLQWTKSEAPVVVQDLKFSVVDVGGQRGERRKWIKLFDNVQAILFVVNLAGYCKVLFEDRGVNRMHESLDLFEFTISNPLFARKPIFLLLNKKDLFDEAIKSKPLSQCFPMYQGAHTAEAYIHYITAQYQSRIPRGRPPAVSLVLQATDRESVRCVFAEINDILIDWYENQIDDAAKQLAQLGLGKYLVNRLAERKAETHSGVDVASIGASSPTAPTSSIDPMGGGDDESGSRHPVALDYNTLESRLGGLPFQPGAKNVLPYAEIRKKGGKITAPSSPSAAYKHKVTRQ